MTLILGKILKCKGGCCISNATACDEVADEQIKRIEAVRENVGSDQHHQKQVVEGKAGGGEGGSCFFPLAPDNIFQKEKKNPGEKKNTEYSVWVKPNQEPGKIKETISSRKVQGEKDYETYSRATFSSPTRASQTNAPIVVPDITIDDNLENLDLVTNIDQVKKCANEAKQAKQMPEKWMILQVHRVYLNDPDLTTLSFANMELPPSRNDSRIIPKLVESLKQNTYLEILDLSYSRLEPEEAQPFAEVLKVNKTLKTMNVEGNCLDASGLISLADGLRSNDTLQNLKVDSQIRMHEVTLRVQEEFADALDQNDTLLKLGMKLPNPHFRDQINRKLMRNGEFNRHSRRESRGFPSFLDSDSQTGGRALSQGSRGSRGSIGSRGSRGSRNIKN